MCWIVVVGAAAVGVAAVVGVAQGGLVLDGVCGSKGGRLLGQSEDKNGWVVVGQREDGFTMVLVRAVAEVSVAVEVCLGGDRGGCGPQRSISQCVCSSSESLIV